LPLEHITNPPPPTLPKKGDGEPFPFAAGLAHEALHSEAGHLLHRAIGVAASGENCDDAQDEEGMKGECLVVEVGVGGIARGQGQRC
jgi:hypothetical protein